MAFVQCSGLKKTYTVGDEEVKALDNVSLTVEKGDFIAICGPSGSGKSTLANVIGGLDQPDEGSVMVDGVDLAKAKELMAASSTPAGTRWVIRSTKVASSPWGGLLSSSINSPVCLAERGSGGIPKAARSATWARYACNMVRSPKKMSGCLTHR